MDFLTHAFSVIFVAKTLGGLLVGFGITGTILPDLDILLHSFSNRDPRLYIFSHGGITHSIAGAVLLSIIGYFAIILLQSTGFLSLPAESEFWILGLFMIIGGSLLHITLDHLAYPGIPLFFPISDRKYTLGIFPGPSLFLMGVSFIFLIFLIMGISDIEGIFFWGVVFFAFIALNLIKWGIARHTFRNQVIIPTFHPLEWILVAENDDKYVICRYSLTRGISERAEYEKLHGVKNDEIESIADDAEIKRVRYFSYFTVAEQNEGFIRIYDPLRVSGLIQYPPHFRELSIESSAVRD